MKYSTGNQWSDDLISSDSRGRDKICNIPPNYFLFLPLSDGRPTPGGTVVKSVPCNHRKKYLDGQWEDTLFAEEPGYIVVRREIEQKPLVASVADLENNGVFERINKTRL